MADRWTLQPSLYSAIGWCRSVDVERASKQGGCLSDSHPPGRSRLRPLRPLHVQGRPLIIQRRRAVGPGDINKSMGVLGRCVARSPRARRGRDQIAAELNTFGFNHIGQDGLAGLGPSRYAASMRAGTRSPASCCGIRSRPRSVMSMRPEGTGAHGCQEARRIPACGSDEPSERALTATDPVRTDPDQL